MEPLQQERIDEMLSANSIMSSTQIEADYKKARKALESMKEAMREQYNMEWADFDRVQTEKDMPLENDCLDCINDRLELWCKIDETLRWLLEGQIKYLGEQVAKIKTTEKKCLEKGK